MNYLDLAKARKIYAEGRNVTEFLRKEFKENGNTSEIIEIAYDLQAGSYIEYVNLNRVNAELYANELAELIEPHLSEQSSVLDVGAGELTTLSLMLNRINVPISHVYAFDISWSRLYKGRHFFEKNCNSQSITLFPFVADIKRIPLCSKSVDVVTSSHALEPNGKNLANLLTEIFRVAKNKCVLFEPSYEFNSDEGRRRMDRLGYIKNIEGVVNSLGGKVLDINLLKNIINPLNPTACFIIEPNKKSCYENKNNINFSVPGTDMPLTRGENFYTSSETGLIFPILKNIPILKNKSGILGTSLFCDD